MGKLVFIPKFEKTACRLKKESRKIKKEQSSISFLGLNLAIELADFSSEYSNGPKTKEEIMANNRTLKKLAAPNLN